MMDTLQDKTIAELEKEISQLKQEVDKRKKNNIQKVYKEITKLAKDNGYSLDEVIAQGKPKKRPAKYKHPTTHQEWSGYGKQPNWIKAYIADGNSLDDLLVG